MIELSAGELRLSGGFTFDQLGTIHRTGGHIVLDQRLVDPDGVFEIDSTYGSIDLGENAEIRWMTITTTDGARLVAAETGASLQYATIAGELAILPGVELPIDDSQLAGGSISLEGAGEQFAKLTGSYNSVLEGTGEVVFNGADDANRITLDIGQQVTVRTGASGGHLQSCYNDGQIILDNPDAKLYIEAEFYNRGQIIMSDGTLVLDGADWLYLEGNSFGYKRCYLSSLGDIQITGGKVWVTAHTMKLDGIAMDLDQYGSVEVFDDVTFSNGSIVSTGDNQLIIRGKNVDLSGLTMVDADIRVAPGGELTWSTPFAEGRRLILNGDATGIASAIVSSDGETIFNGSDNANVITMPSFTGLGATGVIRTGTTGGTINSWGTMQSLGTIIADTLGATLTIDSQGSFLNRGEMRVGSGAEVVVLLVEGNEVYTPKYYQYANKLRLDGGKFTARKIAVANAVVEGNGDIVGDVEVASTGTIAPGFSAGRINIDGNLSVLAETPTMQIELGGTSPGEEYDQIAITGDVALDGVLALSLIDDYVPSAGDVFEIMTYQGDRTGRYDHVDTTAVGALGDLALAVLYDDDLGGLDGSVLVRATLIGDANADNSVDIADLTRLSQNYGRVDDVGWTQGDFNQDGSIDIADLVQLSQHYGQSVEVLEAFVAVAQTPEPATAGVVLVMMSLLHRRGRRSA